MDQVTFEFELAEGKDPKVVAALIAQKLNELETVDKAEASGGEKRTGLEIVALVMASVTLLQNANIAVDELKKFVKSVKEVLVDLGVVKITAKSGDNEETATVGASTPETPTV